jgi:hypothetical protein
MARELIRTWEAEGFKLELYDTNDVRRGKSRLAYRLHDGNELIFEGDDFGCSPLHATDSDATVASLLNFLSLRPGDTDREYFESYSERQMEWCRARGELLGMLAHDLERLSAAVKEAELVIERQQGGEEMDAGFDAGEFSGPAHAEILDRLLDEVAGKHGLSRTELDAALNADA